MYYSKGVTTFLTCFLMQSCFAGNPVISGAKLLGNFAINYPNLIFALYNKDRIITAANTHAGDSFPVITQLPSPFLQISINDNERDAILGFLNIAQDRSRARAAQQIIIFSFLKKFTLDRAIWKPIKTVFENWHTIISASPDVAYKKHLGLAAKLCLKDQMMNPFRSIHVLRGYPLDTVFVNKSIIDFVCNKIGVTKKIVSLLLSSDFVALSLEKEVKNAQAKEKKQVSIQEKLKNIGKTIGCVFASYPFITVRMLDQIITPYLWQKARECIWAQESLEAFNNPNGKISSIDKALRARVNHQQRLAILFAFARYGFSKKKYDAAVDRLDKKLADLKLYKELPDDETCNICKDEDRNGRILPVVCTDGTCSNEHSVCLVCFKKIMDQENKNCSFCRGPVSWGIVTQLLVAKKSKKPKAENGV